MARKILASREVYGAARTAKAVLRTLAEQSWEGVEIEIFDTLFPSRSTTPIRTESIRLTPCRN